MKSLFTLSLKKFQLLNLFAWGVICNFISKIMTGVIVFFTVGIYICIAGAILNKIEEKK
jgi:uncharacterized membrane protein